MVSMCLPTAWVHGTTPLTNQHDITANDIEMLATAGYTYRGNAPHSTKSTRDDFGCQA